MDRGTMYRWLSILLTLFILLSGSGRAAAQDTPFTAADIAATFLPEPTDLPDGFVQTDVDEIIDGEQLVAVVRSYVPENRSDDDPTALSLAVGVSDPPETAVDVYQRTVARWSDRGFLMEPLGEGLG